MTKYKILLPLALLGLIPLAAFAETDMASVLMANATTKEASYEAASPLLLLSWPDDPESVRYEVEIFRGLPADLDRNRPAENPLYHNQKIYTSEVLIDRNSLGDLENLYWRVRPINAEWEGIGPFSSPRELRSTAKSIGRRAPYPKVYHPGNGATLLYPVYTYAGVPGAAKYEVEVTKEYPENVNDFRPSKHRVWSTVTTLSNVYDQSPRIGTYYWRVRGMSDAGNPVGTWSLPEKVRNSPQAHIDVGIFGDSITQGGGHLYHSPADMAYSYVAYLDFPAINMGKSGDTTEMMENRFEKDVLPFHVKTLLIMGGINDLRMGQPPEKVIGHLRNITDKCRAHGITPILLTIVPLNPDQIRKYYGETTYEGWRDAVDMVNEFIRTQPHIDTAAPFRNFEVMPAELALDGIHGDWNAKQMIAGEINREIGKFR